MKRAAFIDGKPLESKEIVQDGIVLDKDVLLADNKHFNANQARENAKVHAEETFKKRVDSILGGVQYAAKSHGGHKRYYDGSDADFIVKNSSYFKALGYSVRTDKIWKWVQGVYLEW
jgi:hypothetical protein